MAMRRMAMLSSPWNRRECRGEREGTTSTSWLPAITRRLPATSKPAFSSRSICLSPADTNTSIGAPFWICCCNTPEAAKLKLGAGTFKAAAKLGARAWSGSVKLTAAPTNRGLASAGTAATARKQR